VKKALEFDIKVWNVEKLTSVLDRCQAPPTPTASTPTPIPVQHISVNTKGGQLSRLLESERLHGTTERDPTQRRHDYIYFSKGSYYVLVEDMRQELATIAALEYTVQKGRDGKDHGAWPVLYCHPRARNPFIEYNEREERRREKADQADKEREEEIARRKVQVREEERRRRAKFQAEAQAQRHRDLRRAISMQNLRQQAGEVEVDLDADFGDGDAAGSAAASGYLASGAYVAASGNSVSITSTTGTTSTAGAAFRTMQLPASLRDKIDNQVVTSRRLPNAARRPGKENLMGPPLLIPDRPQRMLRKSKSTTTMRLAKRDEGSKPGYCECCRVKFEDFKQVSGSETK
jgi:regulatory subunit for Cdc7p protein kinase